MNFWKWVFQTFFYLVIWSHEYHQCIQRKTKQKRRCNATGWVVSPQLLPPGCSKMPWPSMIWIIVAILKIINHNPPRYDSQQGVSRLLIIYLCLLTHTRFPVFPPQNTFQLPHHIIALMETFSLTQGFQNTSQHEIDNFNYYKHTNNHEVGHCSCWQLFITSPAYSPFMVNEYHCSLFRSAQLSTPIYLHRWSAGRIQWVKVVGDVEKEEVEKEVVVVVIV